ncbi:hypothetical protein Daesc_001245 [Daldinia eschscholtzii]|uniref:E2 ubiquitin-conjugating enzyme n=1 Tax=Daldinia eschscholtzii TaxID=292717 RepID=A0AAX6N112_9PEZI
MHVLPPVGMMITLPSETDLYHWSVTLAGPPASVYSGGTFTLSVNLPRDYPFKAPQVTFVTRIYHPNVTNDSVGSICLSILKPENWKPASRVRAVLDSIRQLLVEPNPDDPLEPRIAEEFKNNPREFEKNARAYVARYAQPQSQPQSQHQPTKK